MDSANRKDAKTHRKIGEIRLGPLNLPARVLQALRADRLVVFAGAGVSKPSPSNLPDFEKLTQKIAEGVLERKSDEPLDIFLGRLAQERFSVHEKAERILGIPTSRHSDLHSLLVGLFPNPGNLRIVTTNFDCHFESAIAERWPTNSIEIYSAPALPIGSQFSGLAYVHGRLGKDPQRLVLTDSDFGRAYLTEGWARRFLREVFASYDILFIGYKHEDVVLRYLARGLPPTRERFRFALTGDGDPERWQFLGIEPIGYDPADQHVALREGLKAWLDLEGRGPLRHEREVQGLVVRSPQTLTEQEEDYLLFCVRDSKLAQFFYRHATGAAWLTWASEHSLISRLFDPNDESPAIAIAAHWFVQGSLSERGDVARELVYRERRLSWQLWSAIARAVLQALKSTEPSSLAAERAAQWLSILERHDEASMGDRESIDYWLEYLSPEKHAHLAVQVLKYLLRPIVIPEKGFSRGHDGKMEEIFKPSLKVRGSRHWLSAEWERLFKPNLHLLAPHLAPIIFSYLHQAHLLLRSHGLASEMYDLLSSRRSAIEPHEQDQRGIKDAFDILIDAGRDVLDWLLQNEPRAARNLIEAWLLVEAPLVRRLCVYGIAQYPGLSANKKISRVVNAKWLEQQQLRHEVFFLIRGAYKDSGTSARRRLLREGERAYLKAGAQAFDDPRKEATFRAYEFFKFLLWIQEADPSCPLLTDRLEKIRRQYPEFPIPSHPDFSSWSGGVHRIQYISPVSMEELLGFEPVDWFKAFGEADAQKNDPRHFHERGSLGFLAETEKAAARDFEWGLTLAEYLATEELWDHPGWHFLFRSWANQPRDDHQWKRLLRFIQENVELFRYTSDIADMLYRRVENRDFPITEEMITAGIVLADSLWSTLPGDEDEEDVRDWVQSGMDRAGAKLGLFMVNLLFYLWEIHKEEWNGLPTVFKSLLDRMAHATPNQSTFGRVMLCKELHVIFAIDPIWTKENLFPLFDWNTNTRVTVQAWHAFVVWGNPTQELLVEFMPRVERSFGYLEEFGKGSKYFSELLAWIAYNSLDNPFEDGWIKTFLRKAKPADRIEWARTIGSILRDIGQGERRRLWETWLRNYFDFRLKSGIPFEDDEWREMIKWSIPLEEFLPDVVGLLVRRPSVKVRDTSFYHQLRKQQIFQHPDSFADLLLYLLEAEEGVFYDSEFVAEIFPKLLEAGASRAKLRQVAECLAELGCTNAQELAGLIDANP
jgi:hypothetical protein